MSEAFPVAIGVCLDAEAIWQLDLFRRRGVEAAFYVPGITADRWPDAGHEIASHTYGHQTAVAIAATVA